MHCYLKTTWCLRGDSSPQNPVFETGTYTDSVTEAINNTMDKQKVSHYILTELQQNGKSFETKGKSMSYLLGFTIGLLTELSNKDSENYYFIRKKLKELGAPNKN